MGKVPKRTSRRRCDSDYSSELPQRRRLCITNTRVLVHAFQQFEFVVCARVCCMCAVLLCTCVRVSMWMELSNESIRRISCPYIVAVSAIFVTQLFDVVRAYTHAHARKCHRFTCIRLKQRCAVVRLHATTKRILEMDGKCASSSSTYQHVGLVCLTGFEQLVVVAVIVIFFLMIHRSVFTRAFHMKCAGTAFCRKKEPRTFKHKNELRCRLMWSVGPNFSASSHWFRFGKLFHVQRYLYLTKKISENVGIFSVFGIIIIIKIIKRFNPNKLLIISKNPYKLILIIPRKLPNLL